MGFFNKISGKTDLKAKEKSTPSAKELIDKGRTLYKSNQYKDALKAFDRAIKTDPTFMQAWFEKAKILQELGRHEEALRVYDNLLKFKPEYSTAWYIKAGFLQELGRHEEAILAFDQAIKLDPSKCEFPLEKKANSLWKLNRYEEAIQALDQILIIDPNYKGMSHKIGINNVNQQKAWYNFRGCVLCRVGRIEEAITIFDQVLKIDPADPTAKENRELALMALTQ